LVVDKELIVDKVVLINKESYSPLISDINVQTPLSAENEDDHHENITEPA
jgi:hypothetical protein